MFSASQTLITFSSSFFNFSSIKNSISNCDKFSKSNLLCINYNEAVHLSGLKNHSLNEIADNILGLGSDSLIIKQGEDGATFFDKTTSFSVKAYPVNKVMDTTGAGDAFAGGILSSQIAGKNMEESMVAGAAMASFCIENISHRGIDEVSD